MAQVALNSVVSVALVAVVSQVIMWMACWSKSIGLGLLSWLWSWEDACLDNSLDTCLDTCLGTGSMGFGCCSWSSGGPCWSLGLGLGWSRGGFGGVCLALEELEWGGWSRLGWFAWLRIDAGRGGFGECGCYWLGLPAVERLEGVYVEGRLGWLGWLGLRFLGGLWDLWLGVRLLWICERRLLGVSGLQAELRLGLLTSLKLKGLLLGWQRKLVGVKASLSGVPNRTVGSGILHSAHWSCLGGLAIHGRWFSEGRGGFCCTHSW